MVTMYPEIQLTDTEISIMKYAGCSNDDIAKELIFSRRTVEKYFQTIFTKLGARSKADAVVKCIRWGILHPDQFREVIK